MLRWNRILLACLAFGVVLVVVGLIVGAPTVRVEGAYFDRSNGVPAYAGVFSQSRPGLLDPADGNLWLGAGVVLILLAVGAVLWLRLSQPAQASE
jgi:hypothetical protein